MSDVRTDPLTPEEIAQYHEQGFLFPIRVLDDAQVEEARRGARRPSRGPPPVRDLRADRSDRPGRQGTATVGSGTASAVLERRR